MSKVLLPNIYDYCNRPSAKQAEVVAQAFRRYPDKYQVSVEDNNVSVEGDFNEPKVRRFLTQLECLDYVVFCGKKFECNGWRKRVNQALNKYNNIKAF